MELQSRQELPECAGRYFQALDAGPLTRNPKKLDLHGATTRMITSAAALPTVIRPPRTHGVRRYTSLEAERETAKDQSNFLKHRVRYADVATALEDENAISVREEQAGEKRWISLAMDSLGGVLVVVYTERGGRVRLISARTATGREAQHYYEAGV